MLNQHSKKHHRAGTPNVVPDPLVDPGNPSHRYQARSTAHLDRPCFRMVALAASSPGRRSPRSPQTNNAAVMFGDSITSATRIRFSVHTGGTTPSKTEKPRNSAGFPCFMTRSRASGGKSRAFYGVNQSRSGRSGQGGRDRSPACSVGFRAREVRRVSYQSRGVAKDMFKLHLFAATANERREPSISRSPRHE
jgi:hypothetical protein